MPGLSLKLFAASAISIAVNIFPAAVSRVLRVEWLPSLLIIHSFKSFAWAPILIIICAAARISLTITWLIPRIL
jgi:hypothetical protein